MARNSSRYYASRYHKQFTANNIQQSRKFRQSQKALAHIEQYRQLRLKLGSALDDIEKLFFAMDKPRLDNLLFEYGCLYSEKAQNYAIETIPKWKNRSTKMSGQTAERLINLVPKYLDDNERYALLKNLYEANRSREYHSIEVVLGVPEINIKMAELERVFDSLCRKPFEQALPSHIRDIMRWVCDENSELQRRIMAAIEQEESCMIISFARKEIDNLKKLIRHNDHNLKAEHDIQLPFGSIKVRIRRPGYMDIIKAHLK